MEYEKQFFDAGGYEFLLALETRYNCGSICLAPLFYLTKDVEDGPPSIDCFSAAVDDITDNTQAAVIFAITGVILLLAIFGAFPLCSKESTFEEDDDNDKSRSRNYEVEEPKNANNVN